MIYAAACIIVGYVLYKLAYAVWCGFKCRFILDAAERFGLRGPTDPDGPHLMMVLGLLTRDQARALSLGAYAWRGTDPEKVIDDLLLVERRLKKLLRPAWAVEKAKEILSEEPVPGLKSWRTKADILVSTVFPPPPNAHDPDTREALSEAVRKASALWKESSDPLQDQDDTRAAALSDAVRKATAQGKA